MSVLNVRPLREQAHSYTWTGYNLKKQVGCQAAFASRLAPTLEWCSSGIIGWLWGRCCWQASFHRGSS